MEPSEYRFRWCPWGSDGSSLSKLKDKNQRIQSSPNLKDISSEAIEQLFTFVHHGVHGNGCGQRTNSLPVDVDCLRSNVAGLVPSQMEKRSQNGATEPQT